MKVFIIFLLCLFSSSIFAKNTVKCAVICTEEAGNVNTSPAVVPKPGATALFVKCHGSSNFTVDLMSDQSINSSLITEKQKQYPLILSIPLKSVMKKVAYTQSDEIVMVCGPANLVQDILDKAVATLNTMSLKNPEPAPAISAPQPAPAVQPTAGTEVPKDDIFEAYPRKQAVGSSPPPATEKFVDPFEAPKAEMGPLEDSSVNSVPATISTSEPAPIDKAPVDIRW